MNIDDKEIKPKMQFSCGCYSTYEGDKWITTFVCRNHTDMVASPIKVWTWSGKPEDVTPCHRRQKDGTCNSGNIHDCCIRICPGMIREHCRLNGEGTVVVTDNFFEIGTLLKSKTIKKQDNETVHCTINENDDSSVFVFKKEKSE